MLYAKVGCHLLSAVTALSRGKPYFTRELTPGVRELPQGPVAIGAVMRLPTSRPALIQALSRSNLLA
jgi:hypothetical protein